MVVSVQVEFQAIEAQEEAEDAEDYDDEYEEEAEEEESAGITRLQLVRPHTLVA
jgi:hypothetical protein